MSQVCVVWFCASIVNNDDVLLTSLHHQNWGPSRKYRHTLIIEHGCNVN